MIVVKSKGCSQCPFYQFDIEWEEACCGAGVFSWDTFKREFEKNKPDDCPLKHGQTIEVSSETEE